MRDLAAVHAIHLMTLRSCSIADLEGGMPTVTLRHCSCSMCCKLPHAALFLMPWKG